MQNPRGCWRECAAAALALFCVLGLNINAFSVYIPYLKESLALSHSQSSSFLMVRSLFSFGATFFVKFYYDKLEIRLGYILSMLLSAAALVVYVSATDYATLCIAAAVSGLAYGLGGMYPAAILIHRWFPAHEGLAMGICAASTGLAITVAAPILTFLIENGSLAGAMLCQIGFLLICAVVCFLLIRNYPDGVLHHKIQKHAKQKPIKISWMFLASMAVGLLGGCFSFLTMHYTTEGFDPYQVSTIISVVGLVLTLSKFLLGEVLDLWGAVRTNWLFLSMAALGVAVFCLGGSLGFVPALVAACLYGFGNAISTVGLTAYAKDLSTPEDYAATQQQYQTGYLLGGLICAPLSGAIADTVGNYRAFYVVVTLAVIFAMIVIQGSYLKKGK